MGKLEKDNLKQLVVSLKKREFSTNEVYEDLLQIGQTYSKQQINLIYSDFQKRGTAATNLHHNRRPFDISEEQKNNAIDFFKENPKSSLRQFCEDEEHNTQNISRQSASNILNEEGLPPYK